MSEQNIEFNHGLTDEQIEKLAEWAKAQQATVVPNLLADSKPEEPASEETEAE